MIDIGTPDRGAEPRAFTTREGRWKPITADGSSVERLQSQQARMDRYMRSVAGGSAGEIERAKGLLDSGATTQAEFDSIKAKALGG
jgi:hypothetical protein